METIPLYHLALNQNNPLPFEIVQFEDVWTPGQPDMPDRHTYFAIFWVTHGTGQHFIDFAGYKVQPHSLFFLAPGQVHYWEISGELRGFAILFLGDLFGLDSVRHDFLQELDLFQGVQHRELMYPSADVSASLTKIAQQLLQEYQTPQQFGQLDAIRAWLRLLLIETQRRYVAKAKTSYNSREALTRQFKHLVQQYGTVEHTVQAYAERLGVTAGHLTETVKATLGQPAGTIIRQHLALEAKRLLVHSDQTIGEIAQHLQFEDTSYFSRFFKRETGQTPARFRTDFRKKYPYIHN